MASGGKSCTGVLLVGDTEKALPLGLVALCSGLDEVLHNGASHGSTNDGESVAKCHEPVWCEQALDVIEPRALDGP